jgi:hypothetical protein
MSEEDTMATVSVTKALTDYFNQGEGKRPAAQWLLELRALTTAEKRELAEGIVALTGDELATI